MDRRSRVRKTEMHAQASKIATSGRRLPLTGPGMLHRARHRAPPGFSPGDIPGRPTCAGPHLLRRAQGATRGGICKLERASHLEGRRPRSLRAFRMGTKAVPGRAAALARVSLERAGAGESQCFLGISVSVSFSGRDGSHNFAHRGSRTPATLARCLARLATTARSLAPPCHVACGTPVLASVPPASPLGAQLTYS